MPPVPSSDFLPGFYAPATLTSSSCTFREHSMNALVHTMNYETRHYKNQIRSFFQANHLEGNLAPLNNFRRNTPIPTAAEYISFFNRVSENEYYDINLWTNGGSPLFPRLDGIFNFFTPRTPVRKKCYFYMILASNILSYYNEMEPEKLAIWLSVLLSMVSGQGHYVDSRVHRSFFEILNPCLLTSGRLFSTILQPLFPGGNYNPRLLYIPFRAYKECCSYIENGDWQSFWVNVSFLFHRRGREIPENEAPIPQESSGRDYFHGEILDHYLKTKDKSENITVTQLVKMIDQNEYSMETLDQVYALLSGKAPK
jgi:hypothetical protein